MISLGKKWFGGKDSDEDVDGLADMRLDSMRMGDLVDHDLKTWEVTALCVYDYDGFPTREWQLTAGDEVRFLEREEDDGKIGWTLTRGISIEDLPQDITATLRADQDPPQTIGFDSRQYEAVESTSGVQHDVDADGTATGEGREFVSWNFETQDGRLLFLVQWSEQRIAAYEGEYVEEYSFTDILPGGQR
ncbi:MAG: DUF4178 domain-containing protein [Candidatus Latescibacterota bacterium]